MLTSSGPKVLEYNTRFGDPEAQSMIPLLDDKTDLAEVFLACTKGKLNQVHIGILPAFACNVVVAAGGYPVSYRAAGISSRSERPMEVNSLPDIK
jgi:phosphoribosylamine--glycine ligase/phosphoribosylformylglycinamidine cyclo-ligase